MWISLSKWVSSLFKVLFKKYQECRRPTLITYINIKSCFTLATWYCCCYLHRCWSSFTLTIHCHDSHRVACVSVQSHHYHTALIGRHLTGRQQCTHSLPLSSLSPPPASSGVCNHHTVHNVSTGLHQGQRLPGDPYYGATDMCNHHITWCKRCCGEGESSTTRIYTHIFERCCTYSESATTILQLEGERCSTLKDWLYCPKSFASKYVISVAVLSIATVCSK